MQHVLSPTPAHAQAMDAILEALSHVARHHPALVMENVMAWRASMMDRPPSPSPRRAPSDAGTLDESLARRKALAVTYVACRALHRAVPDRAVADPEAVVPDAFLATVFQLLHHCSTNRESERGSLPQLYRTLHQQCFDRIARLLGAISAIRYVALLTQLPGRRRPICADTAAGQRRERVA